MSTVETTASSIGQKPPSPERPAHGPSRGLATNERQIDSADLLGDAACITIRHGGERYLLRATRQGKLLLTK